MARGPLNFRRSDVERAMKAVLTATGLPADRLRFRYDPKLGVVIEPIPGTNGKAAEDGGNELDYWMKQHAGETARD